MPAKKFDCQMTLVFQIKESQREIEQDCRKAHILEICETQQKAFKHNSQRQTY